MNHYQSTLESAEKFLKTQLRCQIKDRKDPRHGGVLLPDVGIAHDKSGVISEAFLLYCNPNSYFYHDEALFLAVMEMLDFTERRLRPDHTMDLFTANPNSGPDTAFSLLVFCKAYFAIPRGGMNDKERLLASRLYRLIDLCSHGVLVNGFHTPNHRWVICAALAMSYRIIGDRALRSGIEPYLAEGIDCNADGEFAERSSGIYNIVNDSCLIVMAEYLDMPELLEHVRRNLNMIEAYFEPDMSVFTGNSTRQDNGTDVYADIYFPLYLYMAQKDQNPCFLKTAAKIFDAMQRSGRDMPLCLEYYMLNPQLRDIRLPESDKAPECRRFFRESGVVRVVKEGMTVTLLRNNPDFLHIHMQEISMFLRVSVNFFNERHLIASEIEEAEDGYLLHYTGYGRYYLPFPEKPETSDWWEMDKSKRPTVQEMSLSIDVLVRPAEEGVRVRFSSAGCTNIPIKLDWSVKGCKAVYGDGFTLPWQEGLRMVVSKGSIRADAGGEGLSISPCLSQHDYIGYLVGGLPPAKGYMHFYCNWLSPMEHEFEINGN